MLLLLVLLLQFRGQEIAPHYEEILSVANRVFYDYPYLYRADSEDYADSLHNYERSKDGFVVLAMDGEKVVGIGTGLPLSESWDKHGEALKSKGVDVSKAYYLGELLVLPEYRGQGLGTQMGRSVESFAKEQGYSLLTLMSIDEAFLSVKPPQGYISSSCTFKKLGYTKRPEIYLDIDWVNVGDTASSKHHHVFWTKSLRD